MLNMCCQLNHIVQCEQTKLIVLPKNTHKKTDPAILKEQWLVKCDQDVNVMQERSR